MSGNDAPEIAAMQALCAELEQKRRAAKGVQHTGISYSACPAWYASVIEHNTDAIFSVDREGRFRAVNAACPRLSGFSEEELLSMSWQELAAPEELPRLQDYFQRTLAGESVPAHRGLVRRRDGSLVEVEITSGRILECGQPTGVFAVVRDVSASVRDRQALERQQQTLQELLRERDSANHAKDHFLASLSHELRTPLTPVLLVARDLEAAVSPDLRGEMAMVRRNVELLSHMIDDLLDLTRIGRGKLMLQRELLDLHAVLDSAVSICAPCAHEKRITIERRLAAGGCRLDGDPARLRQAFWNLLSNAIKFTPPGGTVTIATQDVAGQGQVLVRVTDTGIGIDAASLHRIFDPFEQTGSQVTRQFGGLGLGLAISKAIVELHGGQICADSAGIGQGATFAIQLPCLPGSVPLPVDAALETSAPATRALRILLVEDHLDTAHVLRRLLERQGHCVHHVSLVGQALGAANGGWDLLISDIGLPDGSGFDVIKALRPHVKRAVALSGYGMAEDVQKSLAAGFDEHVIKPLDFAALERIVRRASQG